MEGSAPSFLIRSRGFGAHVARNLVAFACVTVFAVAPAIARAAVPVPGEMFMVSGRYVGDGLNTRAITGLGFRPDVVIVKGHRETPTAIRTSNMTGSGAKLLGVPLPSDNKLVKSIDADGFSVGADVSVNAPGSHYDWVAIKAATGRMVVGTYAGDGGTNRSIAVGMKPDYLIVMSDKPYHAVQRFADQGGDAAFTFADGATLANRIKGLNGGGFTVGSADEVNRVLTDYYYVAWKLTGGRIETGSYTGDGTDNRDVTDPGFTPYMMFLAPGVAGRATVQRLAPVVGDSTWAVSGGAGFSDGIQKTLAGGFQVGADPRVNGVGPTHYWVTLQNPQDVDLIVRTTGSRAIATVGDTVTFTTLLTNLGPGNGTGIELTAPVPPGFTLASVIAGRGSYSPSTGSWTVGSLTSGQATSLQLVTVVELGALGRTSVHRAAVAGVSPPDLYDGNSADSATVRIPAADLAVTMTTDDWTPTAGVDVNLVVEVANTSGDDVSSVTVRDTLPGLTVISWSASQGTFDPATGNWTIPSISAGTSETLRLSAVPNPGTQGSTLAPVALVVSASLPDPDPADNRASLELSVRDPSTRVRSGSYTGNGVAGRRIMGIGFQPDVLIVKGAGSTTPIARLRTMPAGSAKELGEANLLVTGRVTAVDADGFVLGADPSVNAAGVTYHWTAFMEAPGQLRVGTYTGNATDNRGITGTGFQPDYMMLVPAIDKKSYQRFPSQIGDASLAFESGAEQSDRIQRFDSDGFQIGGHVDINSIGAVHHFVCWNAIASVAGGGAYVGDGLDDRNLNGLGFQPAYLLVARREPGSATVTRSLAVTGDLTLPAHTATTFPNGIQSLHAGGFQVGFDGTVNASTKNYLYFGVRDASGADLAVDAGLTGAVPSEGDTVRIWVAATNYGPEGAISVSVTTPLPAGLTPLAWNATQGTYDPMTGIWTVGSLPSGVVAGLGRDAVVDAGTAGGTIELVSTVHSPATSDPFAPNSTDTLRFVVQSVDLGVDFVADDSTPTEGEEVAFSLRVSNSGPFTATGSMIEALLPPGLTYRSHVASQGSYVRASGSWTVGSLATGANATLTIRATAAPAGATIRFPARVTATDQVDPNGANDADSAEVIVQRPEFRVVTGSYVGDGVAGRRISDPGFQPDLLLVKGEGLTPTIARTKTMAPDRSKALGEETPLTAGRITAFTPDGFTVGADPTVNATGVTYHWTAFLEAAGQMRVGTYVGNGVDNRSIGGVGFQPGYLTIFSEIDEQSYQRHAAQVGDASLPFGASGEQGDRIQRFEPDGFQIGGNADVNEPAVTHHFVAWNGAYPRVKSGLYLGNGVDLRPFNGVGFRPRYVAVKRLDQQFSVQRPASIAGDLTIPASASGAFANGLQALLADGFELGTHPAVNAADKVYVWTAFRDVPSVDLSATITVNDSLPNEGDDITWTMRVRNLGPEHATGVALGHVLPAGLTYRTHVPSRGVYNPATGIWTLGSMVFGDSASLDVIVGVNAGTGGSTIAHTASIASADQTDSNGANDQATAVIRVQSADLSLRLIADQLSALEGETVTFTLRVANRGPDDASAVATSNVLPAGLTFLLATPERGSYTSSTGVWSIGALARDDSVSMTIQADVAPGTAGSTLRHVAWLNAADQADPTGTDRADTVGVYVAYGAGMLLEAGQVARRVRPGESGEPLMALAIRNSDEDPRVLRRITLTNRTSGPGTVADRDRELGVVGLYLDDGDERFGTPGDVLLRRVAAAGGTVVLDSLEVPLYAGSLVQLHVVTDVPLDARDGDSLDVAIESAADVQYDLAVTPLNAWPLAPPGGLAVDGMAAAQITVRPTGGEALIGEARRLVFDAVLPANGYEPDILQAIRLVNRGDALAGADLLRVEFWGDGGNGLFDAGTADDFVVGSAAFSDSTWKLTGLSLPITIGGRRIFASADVAASARSGSTVHMTLPAGSGVTVASGNDGPVDRAVQSPDTITVRPGPSALDVRGLPQSAVVLTPAMPGVEMFALEIASRAAYPETLTTLTMTNATAGPGTPPQLDAAWLPLQLSADGARVGTASFDGGQARFEGLRIVVPPGGKVVLRIASGASWVARDGDLHDLQIVDEADVEFSRPVQRAGAWPIHPVGSFPVDGMIAAQITVGPTPSDVLTGSTRTLALDVTVPANGYQPDTLRFLMAQNTGTALPTSDIERLEVWADDGDGVFTASGAAADSLLGELRLSGGSWVLAGIGCPVPAAGLRVFVSCDIAIEAAESRTVQLSLPSYPIPGIGMASSNDGPRDVPVANPTAMTIATQDRVTVAAQAIAPGTVAPGDTSVVLLRLVARNRYADAARTLTSLTVRNRTTDPAGGTQAQLDAQVRRLDLRLAEGQPPIGTAFYSAGRATFTGLALAIDPGLARELVVTASVAPDAADGAVLSAEIEDEPAVRFEEPTALLATFPLSSDAAWSVNGMVADQVLNPGAAPAAIGPGEGPVAAMNLVVPRNGFHDDVLEQVRVVNIGTAGPGDLSEVRLWKDGGNGAFDAAAGDDVDLGTMAFVSGRWLSLLTEPVGATGLRLFVSVRASASPADSATVQFQVPVDGLTMTSANDGPVDHPVTNPDAILISRSGLISNLTLDRAVGVVGDVATVRMSVRNVGSLAVTGVTPSALLVTPPAGFTPLTGPDPASFDLGAGGSDEFVWTLRVDSAGTARFRGNATGTELGTGVSVTSLVTTSPEFHGYTGSTDLSLYAVHSMPFSVRPGQLQVVPMSLTLTNPGAEDASDILFTNLTLRIEDENGGGIVPAELLSRVVLGEGTNVHVDLVTLPGAGSTVTLAPATPIRIQSGAGSGRQVTLTLAFDLSATTTATTFRIALQDAAGLIAEDAVSGAPVSATLEGGFTYPLTSRVARILQGNATLIAGGTGPAPRLAGRGQNDVPILGMRLTNTDTPGAGDDIRLSRMAVQLVDTSGTIITNPSAILDRLRVSFGALTLLDRALGAADDSVIVLSLTQVLTLAAGTVAPVDLSADVASDAVLGPVRLRLASPTHFLARNAGSGDTVEVVYEADPVEGGTVTLLGAPDSLGARSTAWMPPIVFLGTGGVRALDVILEHQGPSQAADVRCDAVTLRLRDPLGGALVPGVLLDRVSVVRGGVEVGALGDPPMSGGEFTVPLAGVVMQPFVRETLQVRFDVKASAPTVSLQMQVVADGVVARDDLAGAPVPVAAAVGVEFPLASGIGRLAAPARELVAGFDESMPAMLVPDGRAVATGRLALHNRAGAGAIQVDSLVIMAADRQYAALAIGAIATAVEVWVADTLWSANAALSPGDGVVALTGEAPISVEAEASVAVELRLVARAGATGAFRLGVRREGIGIVQPSSPLLAIGLVSDEGQTFPFWTQTGSIGSPSLEASYANYPNPFAAGRAATTFAYYLPMPASVSLRIWTARGEAVRTLLEDAARPAGLQQQDLWDGRNGRGLAVTNGVYVAELIARFADGTRASLRRKVAVAR